MCNVMRSHRVLSDNNIDGSGLVLNSTSSLQPQRRGGGPVPQRVLPGPGLSGEDFSFGWWGQCLVEQERATYRRLRHAAFNSTFLGLHPLRLAIKCHQRRIPILLQALEGYGFITCSGWGSVIPMLIVVHDVPAQPSLRAAAQLLSAHLPAARPPQEVADFLVWFAGEWERRNGATYRILQGRDHSIVSRLLRTYTPDELRALASHMFMLPDIPATIGSLSAHINEITASRAELKRALE